MEAGIIALIVIASIVMFGALLYLFYNILTSKLLFKSALKASYKSGFALVALVFLYTITFSLWNSSIMFRDVMLNSTDNLVAETNFQQVIIDSDKGMGGDDPTILMNEDKWVEELGPTMEDMYPTSPNQPFDNWSNIEKQILSQDDSLQLPNKNANLKNTFFYKGFLDIWMYQNKYYHGQELQTLPYLNFGYNEVAAIDVVIPVEDGEDLNGTAIRMNPVDSNFGIPSATSTPSLSAPIPNIGDGNETPNQLLLKEGTLPDANDTHLGKTEEDAAEIGILRAFGEAQDYPVGGDKKLHAKVESNDFVGSPIDHSNFYGEVTGYVEHSAMTFFYANNLNILPDVTKETIITIPYDAFNRMVENVSSIVQPKYEISITFTDDIQYLKDGGSVEDFGNKRSEDNQELFIKTMASYFKRGKGHEFYGDIDNTPDETEEALKYPVAYKWNDHRNEFSNGIQYVFMWSETNEKVNKI